MAFRGTFDHTLDSKHRLTIPSKFRAAFAGGIVLAKAPVPCVQLWPSDVYSTRTEAALAPLNPFHPDTQVLARALNTNAWDVELDAANRIMIPSHCREHAGISKDVVVTGNGMYAELWDRARWHEYNANLIGRLGEITSSLVHPA